MIRVLLVLNRDGHVVRKSLLGMPEKVYQHAGVQDLFGESLIMYTMVQIPSGKPPMELGEVSCKSLVAEDDEKLASMAANLVSKDEVGDITVLAGRQTLDAMDYIGMSYELDILCPNGTTIPLSLTEGKKQVDDDIVDGKYTMRRFQPSVALASDAQIADAISGMETYFNEQDKMTDRDRNAINKIARNVAMLNAALDRERRRSRLDSYDDGTESDIGDEPDIGEELDCLWDTSETLATQISDVMALVNDVQMKFISFMSDMNKKAELDRKLADKVNTVNGRVDMANEAIDGLRNQLGNAIAESLQKHEKRPWVLYIILGISLVLNMINLLL